jgi:hypothetical protein
MSSFISLLLIKIACTLKIFFQNSVPTAQGHGDSHGSTDTARPPPRFRDLAELFAEMGLRTVGFAEMDSKVQASSK